MARIDQELLEMGYYHKMAEEKGWTVEKYLEWELKQLPPIVKIEDVFENPPKLAPEIIKGVLRKGHKMIFTGGSKVGKTWAMMALAIAFASGSEWFGNWCKKSKVLYINMEVDAPSAIDRTIRIANEKCMTLKQIRGYLNLWNLRGEVVSMEEMSTRIIEQTQGVNYDVIIIDPIYKLQGGDENNAGDIAKFTNELDRIATEMGASVVYAHHHTKGAQGTKKAIDRAAGSGVFARDADAMVDVLELEDIVHPNKRAFEVKFTTREFMTPPDKYVWFEFPLFREDFKGIRNALADAKNEKRRIDENEKEANKEKAREQFEKEVWNKLMEAMGGDESIHWSKIAQVENTGERTIRNWVKLFPEKLEIKKGLVFRK